MISFSRDNTTSLKTQYLIILIGGYCGVLCLTCAVGLSAGGNFPFILVAGGIVLATLQLCATWAVLGTGDYWKRAFTVLVSGGIVSLGGTVGFFLSQPYDQRDDTVWFLIAHVVMLGPLLWIISQLPLLFLRFVFQWQIAGEDGPSESPLTILDLMAFTGMVALAFGCLQVSFSQEADHFNRSDTLSILFILSGILLFTQLALALPGLAFVMKQNRMPAGCGLYVLYVFGFIALFGSLLAMLTRGRAGSEGFAALAILFTSFGFFWGIPLQFTRDSGLLLWTRRRLVKQQRLKDALEAAEASQQELGSGED